ncbi:DNA-binding transcriptional regulator LsrR (DeoR family) [Planomicrobium koreense]|uniref:DNA-binding transcriptional regulator LsrR (DeoR family) n=1 Tax=Planococcus koreensis TaxID=112331 RepID=A0A7W8FSF1_9BACL|nr:MULTISPECIES: sugar-binding transcriptional regulator [Planococcus]MBB5179903.1 DNA-binding transcriptional regulator LsrR (DeoR family) [Planococcus koreensis]MDN3450652.1 sugar-binding transcriptional regulator [Planococcus sp. APC 3906]
MMNWEERRQIVKVSRLYYFEGLTQAEIAKKIGVSRPVISKLLNKARESGIVEIYIKDENAHTVELEHQLEKKYGLKEVIVVPAAGRNPEMVKQSLGKAASFYISKNINGKKSLGISWGSTLAKFVQEYPFEQHQQLKIIPLVGGMGSKLVEIHSNLLAYQLAQKMNTTCSYLYAPAMVENAELKNRLVQSADIAMVLEEGRNVDMAVVGIGNPYEDSTMTTMEYLKKEDLQSLKQAGAVGDIGSRFYDQSGKQIKHPLNDLVIGLDINEYKQIPEVVGIVEGTHKVQSLKAALRGGFLDVLVIDDSTANLII